MTPKKAPRKFSPKLEQVGEKYWKCKWKGEDLIFDQFSASRLLFYDEDFQFVIKIDHKPDTSWQSRQTAKEIEFWETLKEDKEYFAQILDYGKTKEGFYWLRQKWYMPDNEENCTTQNLQTLGDLIWKYSIQDLHLEFTDGSGNWMLHNGEVLIYDWGGYKG